MVWFQCEDCGENLKKPKLAGHFRSCSAYKLSCIDCGEFFSQDTVQGHTQCISEAEKYGPKGQNKPSNGALGKTDKPKPSADVDVNVGLSTRPPWFCSLCNTTTTSQQTLLLHADGKKHRAKAKAFHASQKQANGKEQTPANKESSGAPAVEAKQVNGGKSDNSDRDVGKDSEKRKRVDDNATEVPDTAKRPNLSSGVDKEKIKWKKIITKAIKTNPEGSMKLKKLQKLVIKELQECGGLSEDKEGLRATLMEKVASSSNFSVDGKLVRLASGKE